MESEIIFSAINIPDMAFIAQQHGLRVIPCDLELATLGPRVDLIEELVTARTVAIMVAHLFGRWLDIRPILLIAQRYNLRLIEDCAEAFCGFEHLGDSGSDLVLFSFGPIKFFTALGGGVAKVKDGEVFKAMNELQDAYEVQSSDIYLAKLLKCAVVYCLLDVPGIIKPGMFLTDRLNIDHKRVWV
jgi:perosamine synthetase